MDPEILKRWMNIWKGERYMAHNIILFLKLKLGSFTKTIIGSIQNCPYKNNRQWSNLPKIFKKKR